MNKKTMQKKGFMRKTSGEKAKKHSQSKVLYNQKFSTPLRKKRKNEYDPDEEARYKMQK